MNLIFKMVVINLLILGHLSLAQDSTQRDYDPFKLFPHKNLDEISLDGLGLEFSQKLTIPPGVAEIRKHYPIGWKGPLGHAGEISCVAAPIKVDQTKNIYEGDGYHIEGTSVHRVPDHVKGYPSITNGKTGRVVFKVMTQRGYPLLEIDCTKYEWGDADIKASEIQEALLRLFRIKIYREPSVAVHHSNESPNEGQKQRSLAASWHAAAEKIANSTKTGKTGK